MAQRLTKEEEAELERLESLAAARKAGKKAFGQKQYEWASQWYSTAIELEANDFKLHAMRSLCFLRLAKYQLCIGDAKVMIALKPTAPQGYHRKGLSHFRLGEYARAYRTFQDGLALRPPFAPMVQCQAETVAMLESGRGTLPTPVALMFAYYHGDANVARTDTPRVHLDAVADVALAGVDGAPELGTPVDVSVDVEVAAYAHDVELFGAIMHERRVPVYASHAGPIGNGSAADLAAYLRLFFDSDPVHSHYIVYYSGRAEAETGNWCLSHPRLSLADVLDAWSISAAAAAHSRLVIVADCPYSGAWAAALAAGTGDLAPYAHLRNVAVQASTSPGQVAAATALGGEFTQTWLDTMSLDVSRRLVRVGTHRTRRDGLDLVRTGAFPASATTRPALLISPWLAQLDALMALVQTPMAYAQWALADEVVIHCGRRFQLVNVASAAATAKLHDLDLDVDADDDAEPEPECRVS